MSLGEGNEELEMKLGSNNFVHGPYFTLHREVTFTRAYHLGTERME